MMKTISIFSLLCLIAVTTGLQCYQANTVRLSEASTFVSTTHSSSGRLEICYCFSVNNCTWSTVNINSLLTRPWSWKNVQVACRQFAKDSGLPLTGLGNPILNINIPQASIAPNSTPIYPFVFTCDGTETNLTSCRTTNLSVILRIHSLDAFITCLSTNASELLPSIGGSIKLTGTTINHQGVVEMYDSRRRRWETICADGFETSEANVVCTALGYASGSWFSTSITELLSRGNEITSIPTISVQCSGSETDITSCTITEGTSCLSNRLAGVMCTPSTSAEGTVRLVSVPTTSTYRLVEVLYAGRWGSVCNTGWSSIDGQVACRSLGLSVNNVAIANRVSSVPSRRPIWASGYSCGGSERILQFCTITHAYGYAPFCNHFNDALLTCNSESSSSSSLPAGAISGIIAGVLIVLFIIIPVVYAYGRKWWENGRIRGWWRTSRTRVRRWTHRNIELVEIQQPTRQEPVSQEQASSIARNEIRQETTTLSSETSPTPQSPPPPPLEKAELTKAAPPSYNDAINLEQRPPPEYHSDLPPYPVNSIDPAYPPPLMEYPPPAPLTNLAYPPPPLNEPTLLNEPLTNNQIYPPPSNLPYPPVPPLNNLAYPPPLPPDQSNPVNPPTNDQPPLMSDPQFNDHPLLPVLSEGIDGNDQEQENFPSPTHESI